MHIALNTYAGVLTMVAFFAAFIVSGRIAMGDREIAGQYLPFVLAGVLIGLDLIVRVFNSVRLSRRSPNDELVIQRGPKPFRPRRRWHAEVLIALFSDEMGGQYFGIIPLWAIGVAIIAAVVVWGNPLVGA